MRIHARGPSITREAESRERLEILITGECGVDAVPLRRSACQSTQELCAGLVMILNQGFE